jgi:hypothetical protein
MALYRRKTTTIEAVLFDMSQDIPGLTFEPDRGWVIRSDRGTISTRPGDYIYLQDGRAVGACQARYFQDNYEPIDAG